MVGEDNEEAQSPQIPVSRFLVSRFARTASSSSALKIPAALACFWLGLSEVAD